MANDRPASSRTDESSVDPGVELAERRTGMSFQRTRMSADRTLMAVMRTSLSLISFGFTIAKAFKHLQTSDALSSEVHAARNFGVALVSLGILMLVLGIIYQSLFMLGLRHERGDLVAAGLLHGESKFPPSLTLVTALLLLGVGVLAVGSLVFKFGPFD